MNPKQSAALNENIVVHSIYTLKYCNVQVSTVPMWHEVHALGKPLLQGQRLASLLAYATKTEIETETEKKTKIR